MCRCGVVCLAGALVVVRRFSLNWDSGELSGGGEEHDGIIVDGSRSKLMQDECKRVKSKGPIEIWEGFKSSN